METKEIEKEIDEALQESQTPSAEEKVVTEGEKIEGKGATSDATVEVLGRKYNLSDLNQVRELAKDYDRLGRNYAPLLQQVREIQTKLQEFEKEKTKVSKEEEEEIDETTLNYLRKAISKLGVVTEETLREKEEDRRLEEYLQSLEAEYDGTDGLPKFDRVKVLEYCIQNGISDPLAGYKLMNFDILKEVELKKLQSAQTPPPSIKSTGEKRIPKAKKRVFGVPSSEEEISLRDAMLETLGEARTRLAEE